MLPRFIHARFLHGHKPGNAMTCLSRSNMPMSSARQPYSTGCIMNIKRVSWFQMIPLITEHYDRYDSRVRRMYCVTNTKPPQKTNSTSGVKTVARAWKPITPRTNSSGHCDDGTNAWKSNLSQCNQDVSTNKGPFFISLSLSVSLPRRNSLPPMFYFLFISCTTYCTAYSHEPLEMLVFSFVHQAHQMRHVSCCSEVSFPAVASPDSHHR